MSRAALKILVIMTSMGVATATFAIDAHMDPALLPNGCPACHRGHGEPRSPMLPDSQARICLSCHESQSKRDQRAARGDVVRGDGLRGTRSTFLSSTLSQAFVHPMSDHAFSRHEPGAVTCTSCHSPHRGLPLGTNEARIRGMRKSSPRNPNRFEYEMCTDCHGGEGSASQSPLNISRLFSLNSRSYHPVKSPAIDSSPSVAPALAGREINGPDCHGNSASSAARGPHGSAVRHILRSGYTTIDGSSESLQAYALCYDCHDREKVLDSTSFPLHRLHVVDERASCATCHNPHGSIRNRALIRFGEETFAPGVAPSIQRGRLAFVSSGPGSGTCHLTCHGSDHAPKSYGMAEINPLPSAMRPTGGGS